MTHEAFTLQTRCPEETQLLGNILAQFMPDRVVVALFGDLAAGKTCLTHGFGEAYAVREAISSPTFTLVNEYHGTKTIYHLDLYRLTSMAELFDLGYEDLMDISEGICLIEWAERAGSMLPDDHIAVHMIHRGEDLREISIQDNGLLLSGWREAIEEALPQDS